MWHAIVHTLDVLIVTTMDTSQQIAQTRYLLQACWHDAGITPLVDMTGQHLRTATPDVLTMTMEIGTDSADLDLTHITPNIGVIVIVIPTEGVLDHFINLHATAPCITEVPAYTATTMTHHIADPHHTDIFPEMTVDPEHIDPAGNSIIQQYNPAQRSSSSSQSMPWKPKDRRHKQVTIDNPPSEYYSSDEQDSDSEDELN